jgi:UDP-N-acetylglucosamine diphosphorylase / glucose-1-phosphate thymidylyltransferase / UDP-N-acetylgalactosamine diphosphorylase / glucosamine-1-phosphate N-acetyltransferase / galactosamine-1-phosphate N-acetyltransferase
LHLEDYVAELFEEMPYLPQGPTPWELVSRLAVVLDAYVAGSPPADWEIRDERVWVHRGATIEEGATLKPPLLVAEGCFVAAHSYLRGGVALGRQVRIGPGCEVKSSLLMSGATLAHFNFVGDSIIGRDVNLEAGAVLANHWNERRDKTITVWAGGQAIVTGAVKFGALLGDRCRIGANAVLSPGTLLRPDTVVGRLQLIDQSRA